MLNLRVVSLDLFDILLSLMKLKELSGFSLGGGTSLALRLAHRSSIDIDLFSVDGFDTQSCLDGVVEIFPGTECLNRTKGSLCLVIQGVKVDILLHAYPLVGAITAEEGIRLLSLEDIAAMKINAVVNRGSKKDFIDLLALHDSGLQLKRSLDVFCMKYGSAGRFLAIRSLSWFDDAEAEPDPRFLNGWTWNAVRQRFNGIVKELILSDLNTTG
jgi:hypothetical protein